MIDELGVSDVVPEFVDEKKEYSAGYFEWLFNKYGSEIYGKDGGVAYNFDLTYYTVPENYTLFLTNVSVNISSDAAFTIQSGEIGIKTGGVKRSLIKLAMDNDQNINQSVSQGFNFIIPLKVNSGSSIFVSSSSTGLKAQGNFVGYLVPKNIFEKY